MPSSAVHTTPGGASSSLFISCISLLFAFNFMDPVRTQSPAFACGAPSASTDLPFCNQALPMERRVDDLVMKLTLSEKIGWLGTSSTAVDRLGIPKYEWWSEALHGVSGTCPGVRFIPPIPAATSFPQVILTAASFNISLFEAIGKAVSTEARAMYNVGLAGLTFWSPNLNIFRDPRWGRGQETAGEDPLLSSRYGSTFVRALQQQSNDGRLKVAACCKHYTAYDLDNWNGIDRFHFDAQVSQRDLDDTFQPPFKSCVMDGNAASVMCSYNKVNGKPTCADPDLLAGIVRNKWNLNGYIVSDCDSLEAFYNGQHYTNSPEEVAAKALLAGLDLNCGTFLSTYAGGAVQKGLVNESAINTAVSNNFATLMRLGFFDGDPSKQLYGRLGPKDVCSEQNQELAREAARQGIVLLKNAAASLPLSRTAIKSLAVIGPNSNATKTMIGNYAGTPCKYTTPLQGLAGSVSATKYHPGCSDVRCANVQAGDAATIAGSADATVVVVGTDQSIEAESVDRTDIKLPGQQELLVTAVAAASKGPVILVVMSGGGVDISFAKNNANITSILWVGFPGQAGGAAIADVIFGAFNPSGKLPMTWYPQSYLAKVPMTNMNMRPDPATGYPGRTYRFYTGETVYKFGDGISYSKIKHTLIRAPQLVSLPLENDHLCRMSSCTSIDAGEIQKDVVAHIHLKVSNRGGMRGGSHTVFLFSTPPSSSQHDSPNKKLLGFEKVWLAQNAEAVVRFRVNVCKDLSVVDKVGNTKLFSGLHTLHVGTIRHMLTLRI